MSRLLVAGALATLVGIGAAVTRPPSTAYPEYCAPASATDTFCINYDPQLGRYECPPRGLPCDVVRAAMASESTQQPTLADRVGAGAIGFLLTCLAWAVGSIVFRRRRPRSVA